MIKISYIYPFSLLDKVEPLSDFYYIYIHLLKNNPSNIALIKQYLEEGGQVMIDGSKLIKDVEISEYEYVEYLQKIKPTYYLIPDVFEDGPRTEDIAYNWIEKYGKELGKPIGIVQGKTFEELVGCYKSFVKFGIETIAFSSKYSYYHSYIPHPNNYISRMMGRVSLLSKLYSYGIIRKGLNHHLLGISLPQEGLFYQGDKWEWITSLSTTNPIINAYRNVMYEKFGLVERDENHIEEFLKLEQKDFDMDKVLRNINNFKFGFWSDFNF